MKGGLRLQLLVLLGVLMLLSYVPLFFATSTYTRWGLEQLQRSNAEKLGRSVAAHLAVLRQQTTEDAFLDLARAQIERESVHALSLLMPGGPPLAVLGDPDLLRTIANEQGFSSTAEVREVPTKPLPEPFVRHVLSLPDILCDLIRKIGG